MHVPIMPYDNSLKQTKLGMYVQFALNNQTLLIVKIRTCFLLELPKCMLFFYRHG